MNLDKLSESINQNWTDIYYNLHERHADNLTHQAIRLLQYLEKNQSVTIGAVAYFFNVSHNTASEHVKRLLQKKFVQKQRDSQDERKVYVTLTVEGEDVVKRHTQLDQKKLQKVLQQLNEDQLKLFEDAFSMLSQAAKSCF
ncbi:MarR family winged helix-turn-helix transcriptional regulator [Bacillus changyiensis]|uniref:MarR family winged helix-turn-helix transcriptional regulator n=1 Tax=Bacillus changyiensis TaxID=3004103 RepID=UPI0022DE9ED2|nr:MarR family transcriptional regulator [Bacillus changyiensis]MDA1477900.1 MarR family transcriptional regulator [Bacillus changyiensis]